MSDVAYGLIVLYCWRDDMTMFFLFLFFCFQAYGPVVFVLLEK